MFIVNLDFDLLVLVFFTWPWNSIRKLTQSSNESLITLGDMILKFSVSQRYPQRCHWGQMITKVPLKVQ